MSQIVLADDAAIFTSGLKFCVCKKSSDDSTKLDSVSEKSIPNPLPRKDVNEVPQPPKDNLKILCSCSSPCGEYFAFADDHKQLTVWSWKDLSLVKQWNLLRRANSIIFDNESKSVLAADKSGDVFKLDLASENEAEGKCLLGHFSMLLDLTMSRCGKFILTSDRDEKIRVSHYPNAYNIHNYCLGHTDFVSSIVLSPINDNVLISGSGDGTIRSWNYLKGQENDQVLVGKSADLKIMDDGHEEEVKENDPKMQKNPWPAILTVKAAKSDTGSAMIAVTVEEFNGFVLFSCDENSKLKYLSKVILDNYVWDLKFISCQAIIFAQAAGDNQIATYDLKQDKITAMNMGNQSAFFEEAMNVKGNQMLSELHKRWFDNVKEYMERKQERVANSNKKIKLDTK